MQLIMSNGIYGKITVLVIVVGLTSVVASCTAGPAPPARFDLPIHELHEDLPDAWIQDLHRWLALSYVEQEEVAGFAWLTPGTFTQSDLYTTCMIITILTDLGEDLDPTRRETVGDWIASNRTASGYYAGDLESGELPVIATYRVVSALSRLGWSFEASQDTVHYLLSLQQPDGLFVFSHDLHESYGSQEADRIVASLYVIRTLRLLGFNDTSRLSSAESALKGYLQSQLGPGSMGPGPESGTVVLAVWALSLLDQSEVTQEARSFIQLNLQEARTLTGDSASIAHISNVVNAARELGIIEPSNPDAYYLQDYLQRKVLPNQGGHGGFGYGDAPVLEPQVTAIVVYLASELQVEYPNADSLIKEISLHETATGWSPFFHLSLKGKEEPTYYALALAHVAGFDDYDPQLVSEFLKKTLSTPGYDLRSAFFAVLGYELAEGTSDSLGDRVKDLSTQAALRLPRDCDHLGDYSYFAKIATRLEFEIHDDLRTEVTLLAQECKRAWLQSEGDLPVMPRIEVLWSLQQNLPSQDILGENEAAELTLSLWKDSGGFGWRPIAYPDIHSTYQALEVLGEDAEISRNLLTQFVLSCLAKYGFTAQPLRSAQPGNEQGNDIWATFEALVILDQTY